MPNMDLSVKRAPVVVGSGLVGAALVLVCCASGPPDCVLGPDPCPDRLDLAAYCGSDRCTASAEPVDCTSGRCQLTPVTGLTIPLAQIAGDIRGRDLMLDAGDGCLSGEFAASLDGQAGELTDVNARSLFRWNPLPSDPQLLELTYHGAGATHCSLGLQLVDGDCVIEHQDDCFE
jgi:hypothetical protein